MIETETHRATAAASCAGRRSIGLTSPSSTRARRGRPSGWPTRSAACTLRSSSLVVMLVGLGGDRGAFDRVRAPRHARDRPAWGIGAAGERVNVWLAAHRTSSADRASLVGSIVAGGVVLPIVAGSIALVLRVAAEVADRGVRRFRAWRRVGVVPRHDARRPRASASRRPSGESAGQRQLPVRSHGSVDRGLRRPRSAAHLEVHEPRLSGVAWTFALAMVRSSRSRACIAACTTRSTSQAASSWASLR